MLKRFISYYRPHRRLFILDMLASLAVSLVGILYPIITRLMLNDLIPEKRYRTIILCGAGLLLLYIVRMLLNYFIQFYGHVMGVRMQAQMRSDMFRHLERLPYSFYDNHETGKIMSRMTNDLQDISELAHHGPENVLMIVGMNKIVRSAEDAYARAKYVAAPINGQRYEGLPCTKTGVCSNCKSPKSICCQTLITRFSHVPNRIKVILVNEELGF